MYIDSDRIIVSMYQLAAGAQTRDLILCIFCYCKLIKKSSEVEEPEIISYLCNLKDRRRTKRHCIMF